MKVEKPKQPSPVMTDEEVADYFGVKLRTFQRRVLKPVSGEINPNDAKPQRLGGHRFWLRANVERLAGGPAK